MISLIEDEPLTSVGIRNIKNPNITYPYHGPNLNMTEFLEVLTTDGFTMVGGLGTYPSGNEDPPSEHRISIFMVTGLNSYICKEE